MIAAGKISPGSIAGHSRPRCTVHQFVSRSAANHDRQRSTVRHGGDAGVATRHAATTTVIARYTRRPKNISDGGVRR